ncbi:MAG: (d)CMP kinase [Thermoplasmata archaeon]|nr:(d)CMP kinase [Thermoplasmata archaeon]
MTAPLVALGGPPGSGKTTAARSVAAKLHLELRSAGDLFRAAASARRMDLLEFSAYAEAHPEVDLEIDEAMIGLAGPGRMLEGRLVGEFLRRRGLHALWIDVTAREEVRAQRIAHRDHLSVADALARTRARERSERDRYARFYGIDLDATQPDERVDASDLTPEQVVERIIALVEPRMKERT